MNTYLAIMTVEDDAITFTIPDLPGYSVQTDGTDIRAAIDEARTVLGDFCGVWLEEGRPLPPSSSNEAWGRAWKDVQGQAKVGLVALRAWPVGGEVERVNISLDSLTLAEIDKAAKNRGLTRSAYLAFAARELEAA